MKLPSLRLTLKKILYALYIDDLSLELDKFVGFPSKRKPEGLPAQIIPLQPHNLYLDNNEPTPLINSLLLRNLMASPDDIRVDSPSEQHTTLFGSQRRRKKQNRIKSRRKKLRYRKLRFCS